MFTKKKIIYGFLALFIGVAMSLNTADAQVTGEQDRQTQNSFTGKVVDATTGQALSDVTVQIEGQDIEATTDEEGKFTFDNLKSEASAEGGMGEVGAGEITIKIEHDGYQSLSETIRPEDMSQRQDSEPMTFELEPETEDY